MDEVRLVESTFLERIRANGAWGHLAFRASRFPLALVVAAVPGVLLVLAAWLGPSELARAVTDTRNVHDAFARFISAVATASAIAVSVATLTLGRELKGVGRQEERHRTNDAYRDRVRRGAGVETGPLSLSGFLAMALGRVRDEARATLAVAGEAASREVRGVTLRRFLEAVSAAAERSARRLEAAGGVPHRIAAGALDFEQEMTTHLLRNYRRMEGIDARLDARLDALEEAVHDVILGANYAKTLDTQWGFSRMAQAITLTSVPAIAVSAGMVLAYGQGAVDALGVLGAAALVGAALFVTLLPMACFVSYVLRFVFLNEHTLPTDSFLLGPESPAAVRRETRGGRGAT